MTEKIKRTWRLSRIKAAELLHHLADTLQEHDDQMENCGINLAEFVKFQIKIDVGSDDTVEVKFSGKNFNVSKPEEVSGSGVISENFSSIKQRMQVNFKLLCESVANAEMPSREIVATFLSDSETMISSKGYGDEFYSAYAELCIKLRQAMDNEDMADAHFVIVELGKAKKACHAQKK